MIVHLLNSFYKFRKTEEELNPHALSTTDLADLPHNKA
jgi:hypothetical protein